MSSVATIPVGNGIQGYPYPVPVASHDDVVKDPTLFMSTLQSFHSVTGTKFVIPVIGGKELNLHVLYIEVTKRGGYDKVVTHKKWREISGNLDFSPTTTSASYALRKHYFCLLFGYEQAYFLRHRPILDTTGPSTFEAIGTIQGKFDCGYLISVKLGEENLYGVLYHPGQLGSSATATHHGNAVIPYTPQLHDQNGRGSKRSRGGDLGRPKPRRSGYNFFFAEKHSMLKSLYRNRWNELTKTIAELWNNLTPEERTVYQNHGLKDKERYLKEMEVYKRIEIEEDNGQNNS